MCHSESTRNPWYGLRILRCARDDMRWFFTGLGLSRPCTDRGSTGSNQFSEGQIVAESRHRRYTPQQQPERLSTRHLVSGCTRLALPTRLIFATRSQSSTHLKASASPRWLTSRVGDALLVVQSTAHTCREPVRSMGQSGPGRSLYRDHWLTVARPPHR